MDTTELKTFCKLAQASMHIPLQIYECAKKKIAIFPNNLPSEWFGSPTTLKKVSLTADDFFFYWCSIYSEENDCIITMGPVFTTPPSRKEIDGFFNTHSFATADYETVKKTLSDLSVITLAQFINNIQLMYFQINHEELSEDDLFNAISLNKLDDLKEKSHKQRINPVSYEDSLRIEETILYYIDTNNIEALRKLTVNPRLELPNIGTELINRAKVSTAIIVSIVARFVIPKGVDMNTALYLSDVYIQEIEKANSITELRRTLYSAYSEFAGRLDAARSVLVKDPLVKKCILYIRQSVDTPIKPRDVADYVEKSLPYVSSRFKNTTGMTIVNYIRSVKIDEGKRLLHHTDMSLSEISDYLGFADQSYFQREFKKAVGITPMQYKNKHSVEMYTPESKQ